VIKWSEFEEGGVRFEAFLPEHENEDHAWLLRASARGHILDERQVPLTWPPRFGPDRDDVAVVEAAVERQIIEVANRDVPEQPGPYQPGKCLITSPDPLVYAMRVALIDQFADAEAALGLTREQTAAFLGLPGNVAVKQLYPFAVTPHRDNRLHRAIALASLLARHERVAERRKDLIDATLRDDRVALEDVLKSCGVDDETLANRA
jgi:hypothetical protein